LKYAREVRAVEQHTHPFGLANQKNARKHARFYADAVNLRLKQFI